jgi:hypothetical protein
MVRRIESMNITLNVGADPGLPGAGPLLYKNLGFDTATQLLYGAGWLTFALGLDRTLQQKPPFSSPSIH